MVAKRGSILLLCSLAVQAQHIRPDGNVYGHGGYGGYGPVGHGYGAYGYPAWNHWAGYGGYPGHGGYYGRYPGYGSYYGRYPGYGAYSGRYPGYGGYGSHFGHGSYTGQKSFAEGARYKRGADQKYELRPMGSGVVNPFGQNSVGLSLSPWYAYSASAYQDYKHHAVKHSKNKYAPDRVFGSEGRERICLVLYVTRENKPSFVDTIRKFIRLEDNSQLDNVLQNPGHVFDQFGLAFSQGGGVATCQSRPVMCWSNVEIFTFTLDGTDITTLTRVTPNDYSNEGCAPADTDVSILSRDYFCDSQNKLERDFPLPVLQIKPSINFKFLENDVTKFLQNSLLPQLVEASDPPIPVPTAPGVNMGLHLYLTFGGGGDRECSTRLVLTTAGFDGQTFVTVKEDYVSNNFLQLSFEDLTNQPDQ